MSSLGVDDDAGTQLMTEAGAGDGASPADTSPNPNPQLDAPGPEPVEDGGNPEDAADAVAPLDADASGPHIVFVTSTLTDGTFGSVMAGDNLCQLRANAAGHPGTFVAWLSRNGLDARYHVTSAGPWYLVTGELAVGSPLELRSATGLTHAIDRDENGALLASGEAWTGTNDGGVYAGASCTAWTLDSGIGAYGSVIAQSPVWQYESHSICTTKRHLYCFQN